MASNNSDDDKCEQCGHREYDHLTHDGACWRCSCEGFDGSDPIVEDPRPSSDPVDLGGPV